MMTELNSQMPPRFFTERGPLEATRTALWNKRWAPIFARLADTSLQKITATDDGVLVLGVYKPGDDKTAALFSISRGAAGLSLSNLRPPASRVPGGFVQVARKHLLGRKIISVSGSTAPICIIVEFEPDAENREADTLILDLDARPPRLCIAKKHLGVPERYNHVSAGYEPGMPFFESLCEWSLENIKTKRRATFEAQVVTWCCTSLFDIAVPATDSLSETSPHPKNKSQLEILTQPETQSTQISHSTVPKPSPGALPATTLNAQLSILPTHVRRSVRTRLSFLERRLLRQKADLPPDSELLKLSKRAEAFRANLYLWPQGSPTWYIPAELIESDGLPAMMQLKQGQKPGDLLNDAFHLVDKLTRRRTELQSRIAESQKALETFNNQLSNATASILELENKLLEEKNTKSRTEVKSALDILLQRNLPIPVQQILTLLDISWTEGGQNKRLAQEKEVRRLPYRSYLASTGEFIRVAKSASDGDAMIKLMPAHHFWLHVFTGEGSHVWLEKPKGNKPSNAAIREAAVLAVYHSKHSHSQGADIRFANRSGIEKKKDLSPGKVMVRRAETLTVRYEDTELQLILERAIS